MAIAGAVLLWRKTAGWSFVVTASMKTEAMASVSAVMGRLERMTWLVTVDVEFRFLTAQTLR